MLICILAALAVAVNAEIPQNYKNNYAALIGKQGAAEILSALHGFVSSHTDIGYSGLWSAYYTTDLQANGYIWDIYSTCSYTPGDDQCGNVGAVCHCYNREHSIPQSWFGEQSPMKADLFHVYPTDGKVNGQRSNYPYGECSDGTNLGGHALGKLGASTFENYPVGTVFEPVDEYKGDLARTYFYMVACYYNKNFTMANEGKKVFTWSNSKAGLSDYAIALFLKWTRQDEVSQKEKSRQEAIYGIQRNRNPFIDCPVLAEYIWGNKKNQPIAREDLVAAGVIDADASAVDEIAFPSLNLTSTNGSVRFEFLPEDASIYTFTTSGQLFNVTSTTSTDVEISLPEGVYMFIVTAEGKKQSFKAYIHD